MTLDFWARTSGTWINVATVIGGTLVGLVGTSRLPSRMQQIITQGLGLTTLFIGFSMAGSLSKVRAGQVDGVIVGYWHWYWVDYWANGGKLKRG